MKSYFFIIILLFGWELSAQTLDSAMLRHAHEVVEASGTLEIISESEARYSEKQRIIILNPESDANLFYVGYDPVNKIEVMDADILDMTGNPIRKVRKSEIRDIAAVDGFSIYSEDRVRYIELSHSEYPYIVEYTFSQRLKGISRAALTAWHFQERSTSAVLSSSFRLIVPEGFNIGHKLYNIDLTPKVTSDGKSTTWEWMAESLPAIKTEPMAPPVHEVLPSLMLSGGDFSINEYNGSMESWEDYGAFLHRIWKDRDAISPALEAQIRDLVADAPDDKEKIARLYRFMQQEKRYVSVQLGIGGWQPFDAAYVEEKGYGDCKALSNYMKSMLQIIGIESYPVIIEAGEERPYAIEDDFVTPYFNHAILYIPTEDMWLECTSSHYPPGYLGQWTHDRRVLLVTPQGGKIAHTPKLALTDNNATETATFTIDPSGGATIDYQGQRNGILHEDWRDYSYYGKKEDMEALVRTKGKLPTLALEDLVVENHPDLPQTNLTFKARAERYAAKAGKRLFVPANTISPFLDVPEQREERHYPLVIPFGYSLDSRIVFEIPDHHQVESLPPSTRLESPYGVCEWIISAEGQQIVIQRHLELLDNDVPASQYNDFREFLQKIAKMDGSKIVLVAG
ncbi:MAG: DUF3857 domain-containing transglutaminase family protein [Saprospiraceae bacterium]